ncbi:armadillo-type protein [Lentinula aff. detonsa]|uniref:Armadillo-type protein n=1 Tax=Lentinula aff. detonsa TaxID=2804958 RepID=A0AA38NUA3_9AGAR|nr:armadillo-type protein [Lentinula aff. detonsa]
MEPVVPPEITAELTQILSNLVLGDNEIRSNAEKAVNERLAHAPDLYLLALAQFAIVADTEVMRSFSLVLLRRLLFRPVPTPNTLSSTDSASSSTSQPVPSFHSLTAPRLSLFDHLSTSALTNLERLLLHSLSHEPAASVRRKTVDTISDVANQGMLRGRPWHALQAQVFSMTQATDVTNGVTGEGLRESAYRVFAGCPNLVMDLQTDAVLGVLGKGLRDEQSIDVRYAALLASVAYLSHADAHQLAQSLSLMYPILDTLPPLAHSINQPAMATSPTSIEDKTPTAHLQSFLVALTPLCSAHPNLFNPHLSALLTFLPPLLFANTDPGPTPTVRAPYPTGLGGGDDRSGSFSTPTGSPSRESPTAETQDEEEGQSLRLSALEFMLSLCEARPSMFRKSVNVGEGWIAVLVRACLEGMAELDEENPYGTSGGLSQWLTDDPTTSSAAENDSPPALYEQSLDRLACAMGGKAILPPSFQYIPSMMANYDWRSRHAGLMAIAAIAEGTGKVMAHELGRVVELVVPMFKDSHPRVRYAACQCVGQLCTDIEEVIEQYHEQLFAVLIPALEDPEPRVHSHAAAALINFCEGVERDTLLPYLDHIVQRLLKLLNPDADPTQVRSYVQEQVITTLAMVADASEATFAQYYHSIMPLLINVLRNANGAEYRKMRLKAMECAGLIAIAVGREIFRPDSNILVELLIRIQKSPFDPQDTQLSHYLMGTWAKICQAMGPEFEPYLPAVMPDLLATASMKADVSVYDEDEEKAEDREGWETVNMDGQTFGIRTAAIEEKCQAFETMVIYASTLNARYAPYLAQSLEITLPALRFYFHDGVREACALLLPMLLHCGQQSGTLTDQMIAATLQQLITVISDEQDSTFLASLYKALDDCVKLLGGRSVLNADYVNAIIQATKRQLHTLAQKRRSRAARPSSFLDDDREDLALLEEMEDFALEEMAKVLSMLNSNHELLVAISSVKELGTNQYQTEIEEDG